MRAFVLSFFVSLTLSTTAQPTGSCPPTLAVDVCDASCGPSHACDGRQLCCPTACGGSMCVDPVTERHFTNLVKPGSCPSTPRGPWICTDTCTGDGDCARALKCCANRCGAMQCQRPEVESVGGVETGTNNL